MCVCVCVCVCGKHDSALNNLQGLTCLKVQPIPFTNHMFKILI